MPLRDDLFDDSWFFYTFKADKFTQAALCLEDIANFGDDLWKAEMQKLGLTPGEPFKLTKNSPELISATRYRGCRDISIYLFAVSLELSLKAVIVRELNEHIKTHKITELFEKIKDKKLINVDEFDINTLNELFNKLDELLIWAGRYPAPHLSDKNIQNNIKKFAQVPGGYTSDIATTINFNLLKNFHTHIAQYFSQHIRPLNISETS